MLCYSDTHREDVYIDHVGERSTTVATGRAEARAVTVSL